MKKIKVKLDLSTSTIALVAIAIFVGYLAGNTFPISGQSVVTQQTTIQQPTQQPTSGTLQISDPFGDDPIIGNKDADTIVIEFSDFQCPFCRRFYTETLSQIEDEYINTGKIAFVYKDFPLDSIHPGATPAAIAAECANEQGKWREMHNIIFDKQNEQGTGTIAFSNNDIKQWASEITGLNLDDFNQCFDSQKYLQEVTADFQEGIRYGVSGTPTFFIGTIQKGFIEIVGAQPYSVLKSAIDNYL